MHHLLLIAICCLIGVAFGFLARRYPVEKAYWSLVSFPALILLVALLDELLRGTQQLNHQLFHLAYDGSYALLLLGLILLLRAVLKQKPVILVAAGILIAGIPLAHIFVTQP